MDDADLTDRRMEHHLALALREVRSRGRAAEAARTGADASGRCAWCEEPAPGRVFCSAECREDAEQAARFRR